MNQPTGYSRRKYGSNHLRLVLCQVQFPVLLRFEEAAFQATVQDALRVDYPRAQQEQQVAVTVGPGGLMTTPAAFQWRYQDLAGQWSVVFQRNFAGLETTAYDHYEDFAQRLGGLLEVLAAVNVTVLERLGLRYINEFRHESGQRPQDWKQLLRDDMLAIVGGELLTGEIAHAIQDIRTLRTDGTFVVRHGYVNSNGDARDPYYLLDLDYFREGPQKFDQAGILDQLRAYHEEISKVFEMSLKPAMRDYLGDESPVDA